MIKSPAILAILAGLGLGACASDPHGFDNVAALPSEHFAIEVQTQPREIRLAPHRAGASPTQANALATFAQEWADTSGGDISVRTPARPMDPAAAYRTASDARDILISRGVAPDKVRIIGYDAGGDPRGPIIVGYARYVARGPRCGTSWDNLSNDFSNQEDKNFGCAVTANVAAQIADPRDILSPRATDYPDAARRQAVLDKYRKGETTSTAKDSQASGAVSTAVQ
ncbi:MAG TPA: CpaD family pilus assembly protein [Caulobacteraceae bacterium]|nr:CpaD family pilus assembly protein [Caulobacteraceae bacterium]